ncbi:DUF2218 domain-containing protein [Hyphomicrobiales bacterium 4NK60-0047b]|jgi:hypothetical protein
MLSSQSQFTTETPEKYLVQMCKHFAHKVETTYSNTQGKVDFPCGKVEFLVDKNNLIFKVTAETNEDLNQSKSIIESHIIRFAFREKLEQLEWQ